MSLFVSEQTLLGGFQGAFRALGAGPVLVHSDLFQVGMPAECSGKEAICRRYSEVLHAVVGQRCVLFPTFNYSFCSRGVYDVQGSPSEVGVFSEYLRQRYPRCRTRTPVFNFCVLNNDGFSLEPADNCFGTASTFGELVQKNGWILFLGAPFSSNTFIHHIEELAEITYRRHMVFTGKIIDGMYERPVELTYRVRPLGDAVVYDWDRLERDLDHQGLLWRGVVGNASCVAFRARAVLDYWLERLKYNERFLLTP